MEHEALCKKRVNVVIFDENGITYKKTPKARAIHIDALGFLCFK